MLPIPLPWVLLGGIGLAAGGFLYGQHVANTACDSARYQAEVAGLTDLVGKMAQRIETINAANEADTARAQADASRLAELQEIIDGIEADDRVCLDRDSDAHRRLRLIR